MKLALLSLIPLVGAFTPVQQRQRLGLELGMASVAPDAKKPLKLTKEAKQFIEAVENKKKDGKVILGQVAPAVRIAFPEAFGLKAGELKAEVLVATLKELGFDIVMDTNIAADLTIMEEGTELMEKIKAKLATKPEDIKDPLKFNMPLFTSCCPGWMAAAEKMDPDLGNYISTTKSPQMMYGAVFKAYAEELLGHPAEDLYMCSVMPCVRKRGESDQAAFENEGVRDVDNVITTKDVGTLCELKGVDPLKLEATLFDSPFNKLDGLGSGAGQLFGITGGVMEAAVRTVYEVLTGESLPKLEFEEVRGLDGLKEATVPLYTPDGKGLEGVDIRVAVCNGVGNAKKAYKALMAGEVQYDFVEVMACPAGCIGGGGQPRGDKGAIEERMEVIYQADRNLPIRKSHENPVVAKLYEKFLGGYGGKKAHELLHVKPFYGNQDNLKP